MEPEAWAGSPLQGLNHAQLDDSTRTTHGTTTRGGTTIDTSEHSHRSTGASDISSRAGSQTGSLLDYEVRHGMPHWPPGSCSRHAHHAPCTFSLQLRGLIGRGKYSQVYAAVHIATGRPVAMKKVRKRMDAGTCTHTCDP
jgi:hypothetical protein